MPAWQEVFACPTEELASEYCSKDFGQQRETVLPFNNLSESQSNVQEDDKLNGKESKHIDVCHHH